MTLMHPPPSGLRPDAAVFIPSGAVSAVNTKASGSVSTNDIERDYDKQSHSNIDVSDKQSRGRSSRNKLRRKKSRIKIRAYLSHSMGRKPHLESGGQGLERTAPSRRLDVPCISHLPCHRIQVKY